MQGEKENMSLLEIYKDRNNDSAWMERFSSLAKNNKGRVFEYVNTNFRTQKAFITHFKEFENIESVERGDWNTQKNHGQEADKHRVVKLSEAKLFQVYKSGEDLKYRKTQKGVSYKKYIDLNLQENESWIINYLYLINGNYGNKNNHIIERTKEVLKLFQLLDLGDKESLLFKSAHNTKNQKELFEEDLFYTMSFYDDIEFLEIYFKSDTEEKKELQEYIIKNFEEKNNLCCISRKYKSGGNYSHGMAIDEIKVFYTTFLLIKIKDKNQQNIFTSLLDAHNKFFKLNKYAILDHIQKEHNIFEPISLDILEIEEEDAEIETVEDVTKESPIEYIDTTIREGRLKANQIFQMKKRKVRELAQYECSLKEYRGCEKHYFTSKATNKNYIEIHHLIPKEYSNRFNNSIEVLSNYVTLCPNCHQLVHKAVDRERKDHLTKLLSERKEKLSHLGLAIETDELLEFYGIDV